jgi:hypothetical protein
MHVNDTQILVPKLTVNLVIKAEIEGSVCFQLLTLIVAKIPKLNFHIDEYEAPSYVTEVINSTYVPPINSTER